MQHCVNCVNHEYKVVKAGIPFFRIVVSESHLCHWRTREDPVKGPIEQPPRDCYRVRDAGVGTKHECKGYIDKRSIRECP